MQLLLTALLTSQLLPTQQPTIWGEQLDAPTLVVDPSTRQFWATADTGFGERLPANMPIANTSVIINGEPFVMLMAPLPSNPQALAALYFHEQVHAAGLFNTPLAANSHLSKYQGRWLIQAEWAALSQALTATGNQQQALIARALAFRAQRHGLFSEQTNGELATELKEGMAEYTGLTLANYSAAQVQQLLANKIVSKQALSARFAYVSGPLYGYLLDQLNDQWQLQALQVNDIASLLPVKPANFRGLTLTANEQAIATSAQQWVAAQASIYAFATDCENNQMKKLPLKNIQLSYDPNLVTALDQGTYYGSITLSDLWGKVTTDKGALIDSNFSSLCLAPGYVMASD